MLEHATGTPSNDRPTLSDRLPAYKTPTVTVMSDEEVLRAFQMTAAQIGAAAQWWTGTCNC